MELNRIYQMDCIEGMKQIPDKSIDMILCDLPYSVTKNKWDNVIPFDDLWMSYERVLKERGVVVLTAQQPFTTDLINSNRENFRYTLVWDKVGTTGFQLAKKRPLRRHEEVCVFFKKQPTYNPQMVERGRPRHKGGSKTDNGNYGSLRSKKKKDNLYYPTSILKFSNASKKNLYHPTQKPVNLFEYLIKTYTNEGETVLDNCMGSGTTAIAAMRNNRNYIGFEIEPEYIQIANDRIEKEKDLIESGAYEQLELLGEDNQ